MSAVPRDQTAVRAPQLDDAARKIVEDISHQDPGATLAGAIPWLVSINETAGFDLKRRFELLDLIDSGTRVTLQRAADSFVVLVVAAALWLAAQRVLG